MEGYEDVEPLPLDTGSENELCQIMYSDEYKLVVGTARALMEQREYSERAKVLTEKVIDLAPAYYTAWNYRFDIVMHLAGDNTAQVLDRELEWLDEVTLNNPKNYQIWSYKEAILKHHPAPHFKRELPILQMMLDEDTKNYHVWSFRKWCVLFFQDFSQELQYTDELLQRDVYNNSAWTHRMFVLKNTSPGAEQIASELEYVMTKIDLVPQNVSVWNYLRGLYENFMGSRYDEKVLKFAQTFANGAAEAKPDYGELPDVESSYALEFLAQAYALDPLTVDKAVTAYRGLAAKYDPIRRPMWERKIAKCRGTTGSAVPG
ncbi:RAM2 (YKL019W) [Zygosaccharomyces parabailii]|uniref:Protein farnesyltransferase/geranylgeranyltransferase type-1 subunit alpha n=1 Tax=Zygosaccharomyces bailii (strain CLIB 213 / ATCC 58445 / CBS 680 / BCRC 21525 / NBRC 1098 / NCYC 1416 / NRRL Y-2227) TaxID=1333698 RepID=A0A8J2X8Y4_ZYGB2|nr:RAM2 (YKL019W) [Zygosaccharomyces parabailii]CDF90381.1 ZYBA0S06-07250g1_1 [Zygosaccharomyces bailii CLIB 213]CDH16400.1 related to Protein farnesyltransferase/geranylgeranyltransferase type-1 subunit alpha [Zygosaccharomyces bailii ISA1307]